MKFNYKTIFIGSGDFGVEVLKYLHKKTDLLFVITNVDKPTGRGKNIKPNSIKQEALELNIKIHQPEKINSEEIINIIKIAKPDFIVVVSYGQILSKELLDLAVIESINVHGSILPKYRGAAPIHFALINDEKETGITIMKMVKELDAGPMLYLKKIKIEENDDFESLSEKLKKTSSETLDLFFTDFQKNQISYLEQNSSKATYVGKLSKSFCQINWNQDVSTIYNFIRGLSPNPCAFSYFDKKSLKIFKAKKTNISSTNILPGSFRKTKKKLFIATKNFFLEVLNLQIEGKKKIDSINFVNGVGKNIERIEIK